MKELKYILLALILFPLVGMVSSCSEDNSEVNEYANWEQRNNEMIEQWAANSSLRKIKSYAKDPNVTGKNYDYIYVEVLEQGNGTESPLFTDTARVAYRGRTISTPSYPEGIVFDESYLGDFSWRTAGMRDFCCASVVEGFTTAVINMHIGDRWRVYIPYQLGYGTSSTSLMEGYSNLIFDIALQDFWHVDDSRPEFKARQE